MAANPVQLSGLARRLVEEDLIEEAAAQEALAEATKTKVPLVTHLVQNELVAASAIANAASEEFGVPLMDLAVLDLEVIPTNLVDEKIIRATHAMPIFHRGNRLFVAVSDPTNTKGLDDIKFHSGVATEEILVEEDKLSAFIESFLEAQEGGGLGDLSDDELDLDMEAVDEDGGGDDDEVVSSADETPVVRFITKMLLDAIKQGASDLHFEPFEKSYRVRLYTCSATRPYTRSVTSCSSVDERTRLTLPAVTKSHRSDCAAQPASRYGLPAFVTHALYRLDET
jgi:type IV pilus assembly protein PilB|tara:strand:- start:2256 stop:3104 length:849 start_codon:yes stop_codon:yes gene_type:complete